MISLEICLQDFTNLVCIQFFHYEPFHKLIQGCKGFDAFQQIALTNYCFVDPNFSLHHFLHFPLMKNGDVIKRIALYHGPIHFIVKAINVVFNFLNSVLILKYLSVLFIQIKEMLLKFSNFCRAKKKTSHYDEKKKMWDELKWTCKGKTKFIKSQWLWLGLSRFNGSFRWR